MKIDPAHILERILHGATDLFIVQIGSNDGKTGDPIFSLLQRNPSWKALLVEPVPFLFERLQSNYRYNSNIQFDNVAIAEKAGIRAFYYIDPAAKQHFPNLPHWFDQLGSFDRGHIARHFWETLGPFIISTELATLPLATLLDRNRVTRMDVLHIDAEGSDWIILRQLDITAFQPKVILFEHKHLPATDKSAAMAFVERNYEITDLGDDFFCRCTINTRSS
jgi:FkbM family methyltransferase